MERQKNSISTVDMFLHPVFRVQNGIITQANQSALQRQVAIDTPVADLIEFGAQEYDQYKSGCLSLSLKIAGVRYIATVLHADEGDLFHLQSDENTPEMRAMALAAQQLREPLGNLMALADNLFPSDAIRNDPTAKAMAAKMNRNLFQLLRSVGNMSDISAYRKDRTYAMQTCDVGATFLEILSKAQISAQQANRTLQFSGLQKPCFCLVDEQMLERALYNLISNALKFSPEGSTVTAKLEQRNDKLIITVADDGSCITPDIAGSIFFRYLREPGIEDGRQGLGLGIPLIQAVASAHGGTLLMDQPEASGTRFTMTLAVRRNTEGIVRSPIMQIDYAGGRDHSLIEFSDVLPASAYENIN